MKKILFIILTFVLATCVYGCKSNDTDKDSEAAHNLYLESVKISRKYADSILSAKDSASVLRMIKEFEEALTKVNYKYPADTYIDIPQSDNDTLTRLSMRVVTLKDSILYKLSQTKVLKDSLEENSDSIREISEFKEQGLRIKP